MNPGILALMIPILALTIPIVAILVSHQQKMAELMHRNHNDGNRDAELAAMREELRVLRETVTNQALLFDSLNRRALAESDDLRDRTRTNA